MKCPAWVPALFLLFVLPALADDMQHHEDLTAQQLGSVHFPVSCAANVQTPFERGVALLHSFWFPEGRKAFLDVLEADPSCAIAYWGIGVNRLLNPFGGQPAENVGAFRAQLVDSLSGKILRIDPATGNGLPSNPFYDPRAPRAPRSRVWVLGLHDPQHFTVRPGSGSPRVADGRPGRLITGPDSELRVSWRSSRTWNTTQTARSLPKF